MTSMSYGDLENIFDSADKIWEEYSVTVKRSLLEWERLRPALTERIAVLKTRISTNLKEMEELKIKVELGLIDEEKAQRKIDILSKENVEMIRELEATWLVFEKNMLKSILHAKRLSLPLDITPEEVEGKIEELESCYRRGVINSSETYDELKKLLNEQLSLIASH
ncbi:hypothetical protein IG193_04345 [Infirmifilum lucidum]|uniref:Uncharacterized protein n=1 Tax=Infirmifilum lucidum TaxID=2776706 RepID=A0A7L9FIU3_9CREN|nr:hypothetical protein [Infirmifilum lucidum]QOJ79690.1 hypothetical protein IG193_04345 [Infirmifilum lucidum]